MSICIIAVTGRAHCQRHVAFFNFWEVITRLVLSRYLTYVSWSPMVGGTRQYIGACQAQVIIQYFSNYVACAVLF